MTAYNEVHGIGWCSVHDDFATEGFEWSDICYRAYVDHVDQDADPCELLPLYIEADS